MLFESIRSNWQSYSVSTVNLVLYWLVLAWLLLFEKEKIKNNIYIYGILVPLLLVALEVASGILLGGRSLGKIFLLVPIGIVIPYGGMCFGESLRPSKKKWLYILAYAIIIQASMSLKYENVPLTSDKNVYKVSSDVIQYAEYINELLNVGEPFLLAPEEIASQIQEYDVNIRVAYGPGYDYFDGNLEQLLLQMEAFGCNCLMVPLDYDNYEYVQSYGYSLVVTDKGYALYTRK